MNSPEYEAIWLKGLAFINRALDDGEEFEQRAFWAACSLKLLANAAVIADPHPGDAQNVFRRCQAITSRFDAVRANAIEAGRSRYLESGDALVPQIPPSQWWANFWPLVDVLLAIQGRRLADFVGADRQAAIAQILCCATEATAARVRELTDQAAEVDLRRRCAGLTADEAGAIAARVQTHHSYAAQQQCPVCAQAGALRGDTVLDRSGPPVVAAEVFACPACGLVLRGPDDIRLAQLPESFTVSSGC